MTLTMFHDSPVTLAIYPYQ